MNLRDKLRVAVEVLDKCAAWDDNENERLCDEPAAALDAREALRKIRGGDGRPPSISLGPRTPTMLFTTERVLLEEALTFLRQGLREKDKAGGEVEDLEGQLCAIDALRKRLKEIP